MYISTPIKTVFILFMLFLSGLLFFSLQAPEDLMTYPSLNKLTKLYYSDSIVYGRVDRIVDDAWLVILLEDEEIILDKDSQIKVREQDEVLLIKNAFNYDILEVKSLIKQKESQKSISFSKKKD